MKTQPTVSKYMTPFPHTIGADQTLAKAEAMMAEHRVRHLPVLKAGKLVGILTDRDVRLVESFRDVIPNVVKVDEAYSPEPFITTPQTAFADVCAEMAAHKYGCAIVCDNNKLVGIFTWVDALRAFRDVLETRLQ